METIPPAVAAAPHWVTQAQRRVIAVLVTTQILGGVGMIVGMSVGALLVAKIAGGPGLSGLAQSCVAVGAALIALPVARLMDRYGRRIGLVAAYLAGAVGAVLVITAAMLDSTGIALVGMFLFGGGTAAGLQARYSATDLSDPSRRARHLSFVVWATTVGAVAGPTLAEPADRIGARLGLPTLSGPFGFSLIGFLLAAGLLMLLLRPDPLLTARRLAVADADTSPGTRRRSGFRQAGRTVVGDRNALLGLVAAATGHAVMLAVMVMTPIHIDDVVTTTHAGHAMIDHQSVDHQSQVLRLVGIVLSLHVAGMFAFSPVVGWLADRFGRRSVLFAGALTLILACGLAATSGANPTRLAGGLFLLGLGWSCTMIAGSTLLTESVPPEARPSAQGLSDVVTGLAGATAGAFSGVVVQWASYPALAFGAAMIAVPLLWAAAPWVGRTVVKSQSVTSQPVTHQPVTHQPVAHQPVIHQPAMNQQATDQHSTDTGEHESSQGKSKKRTSDQGTQRTMKEPAGAED